MFSPHLHSKRYYSTYSRLLETLPSIQKLEGNYILLIFLSFFDTLITFRQVFQEAIFMLQTESVNKEAELLEKLDISIHLQNVKVLEKKLQKMENIIRQLN